MPRNPEARAFVGMGSNLGDGAENIALALQQLAQHPEIHIKSTSGLYLSEPWGVDGQGEYTNAVAELACRLSPSELLSLLLSIEQTGGRNRDGPRWSPRTIDLDLLLFDQRQIQLPDLVLPHPRMHLRSFVLIPLLEVEPDAHIPGMGLARDCLRELGEQGVNKIK